MPGRLLLVDDDRAITQSLGRLLSREGYYIEVRATAEEAVAAIQADPAFDLALLDVGLPGEDGYACCRRLRATGWRQPVLMLTGRGATLDKVLGLQAGADDYLVKPCDPQELLARVRAHLRRAREYSAPMPEEDGRIVLGPNAVLDPRSRDAVVRGVPARLTEREYELLALLARHPNQALDRDWLYQQIWGLAAPEGIKVLAVYLRRLRLKVEDDPDRPQILQTVRGYGYKWVCAAPTENDQRRTG